MAKAAYNSISTGLSEHGEPASAADDRFCYPNSPGPEGRANFAIFQVRCFPRV